MFYKAVQYVAECLFYSTSFDGIHIRCLFFRIVLMASISDERKISRLSARRKAIKRRGSSVSPLASAVTLSCTEDCDGSAKTQDGIIKDDKDDEEINNQQDDREINYEKDDKEKYEEKNNNKTQQKQVPMNLDDAIIHRGYIVEELCDTERRYTELLGIIIHDLMEELDSLHLPEGLIGKQKVIFGNVKAIHAFHKEKFLPDLEAHKNDTQSLALLFKKYETHFRLYMTYCENKERSNYLLRVHGDEAFQKKLDTLSVRHTIEDLLMQPVQRVLRYTLLLEQILKYTERAGQSTTNLKIAIDIMRNLSRAVNNMMEIGRLQDFEVKLASHGALLMQDTLNVAEVQLGKHFDRKYKPRRVFLFEQIIIFSEPAESAFTGYYYKYKYSVKLSNLRMLENVFQDKLAFEIMDCNASGLLIYVQAADLQKKSEWTDKIRILLDRQFNFIMQLQDPMSFQ